MMTPFHDQAAIAIDGGGIKGLIVAKALEVLEKEYLHKQHPSKLLRETFQLTAGTSTGSIIAAGIAAGLSGKDMTSLYCNLGPKIFHKGCRARLWPLTRYRYALEPLEAALKDQLGNRKMGAFASAVPPSDVIITVFGLKDQRTHFVKPWKSNYKDWPVVKAVLASCAVPTYFPVVEGPETGTDKEYYADGGVGGYSNPCFLAAYELRYCLPEIPDFWDPDKPITLISLGTGRAQQELGDVNRLWPWQWLSPLMDDFLHSANDHQVHLVTTFFKNLDFRRFQVDLDEPIAMDDARPETLKTLKAKGKELGYKILNDEIDRAQKEHGPFRIA